ncbi:DUF2461 domain-containing protein [Pelagibius sp. Alg239-R121]|uniref:DUF2461 domain-containing protein n=1 Tax=Pelagibius sp. Alg239-R121 TaxID=2993448 RepID=UPI0024A763DE|nr:DUF2461 domain-containing protein [Pelagibius sp. Alg239-R121]
MQANGFPGFPAAGIKFLQDLTANNNRPWFEQNRALYKKELEAPAKAFAAAMERELAQRFGVDFKGKIFRLHRDLRFSKDKTPYNTHLRMAFFPFDAAQDGQGFYFSLEPECLILGGGAMGFSKSGLETFRQAVVDDAQGHSVEAMLVGLVEGGFRLEAPELKRVPAGFDKAHPREALLRRKSLTLWRDLSDHDGVTNPRAVAFCAGVFENLRPLYQFLGALRS